MSIGNVSSLHGVVASPNVFPVITTSGTSGVGNVITASVSPGWVVGAWQWYRQYPNNTVDAIAGANSSSYAQNALDTVSGTSIYPIASGLVYRAAGVIAGVSSANVVVYGTPVLSATTGIPYNSFTVTATGGLPPYVYSILNGPTGMVINSGGVVTYPSPALGSYVGISIRATDSNNTVGILPSFNLNVANQVVPLVIIGTPVTTAVAGTPYAGFDVDVTGGTLPYAYSIINGPAGMTVNSSGVVSYSVPTQGTYSSITIRVTDAIGAVANLASFTLTVSPAAVVAPVNNIAPVISGLAQQGSTLSVNTGTWANTPTAYVYQWKRAGSPISGANASTFNLTATDIGSVITVTVTASNSAGSAAVTTLPTAVVTILLNTKPKFGYAIANPSGQSFNFQTLLDSMVDLTGSNNAGHTGTFNTVSSSTNYTWLAVLHSAAPTGIHIFDGTGTGGFSGAASSGLFFGSDVDPITTYIQFTDVNNTVWDMYRSNGKAQTFSTFTLS